MIAVVIYFMVGGMTATAICLHALLCRTRDNRELPTNMLMAFTLWPVTWLLFVCFYVATRIDEYNNRQC